MLALTLTLGVLSGGLLQDREPSPHLRLIETGAAEFVLRAVMAQSLDSMSRTELEMERLRLKDDRRSVGAGIALTIGGGVTLLIGLAVLSVGLDGFDAFLAAGLVISGVGVAVLALGIVLMVVAISHNSASASRIREIDDTIRQRGLNAPSDAPPPPPGGSDVPPPPPPPPPGADLGTSIPPSLVLARF